MTVAEFPQPESKKDLLTAAWDVIDLLDAGDVDPKAALVWANEQERKHGKDVGLSLLRGRVEQALELPPLLAKVRGKNNIHVRVKRSGVNVIIHKASRGGGGYQISDFDKDMRPWGHRMWRGGVEDALRDVWKENGAFELVVAESARMGDEVLVPLSVLTDELVEVRVSPAVQAVFVAAMKKGNEFLVGLDTTGNVVINNDIYKAHKDFDARVRRGTPLNVQPSRRLITGMTRGAPHVDVEMRKLLAQLVRMDPSIRSMRFEGGRSLTPDDFTVGDWLDSPFFAVKAGKLPPMYHGTSNVFADHIAKFGLKPRGEGGVTSHDAGGAQPSNPKYLYLATGFGPASVAAENATKHGGRAIVYAVTIPDPAKLRQDEDAERFFGSDPLVGLTKFGTVAYEGRIPASFVKPYRIRGPGGWGVVESLDEASSPVFTKYLDALEAIAGNGQLVTFGGQIFAVGDKKGGVFGTVGLHPFGDGVNFAFLGVAKEDRGKGNGGRIMSMVTAAADKAKVPLYGDVDPQGDYSPRTGKKGKPPMNKAALLAFYKKFGFVLDKPRGFNAIVRRPKWSAPLREVFDKPYEYKNKRVTADSRDATFGIDTEDGHIGYEMNLSWLTEPGFMEPFNLWELHFHYAPLLSSPSVRAKYGTKDSFEVLGAGNAGRVLATVVAFVKDTKKQRKIEGMVIGAKEPSRRRLYRAMLTRFSREQRWKLTSTAEHKDIARAFDAGDTFEWFLMTDENALREILKQAKTYDPKDDEDEEEEEEEYYEEPDDTPVEEQPHSKYMYAVMPARVLDVFVRRSGRPPTDSEWFGGYHYNVLRDEYDGFVQATNALPPGMRHDNAPVLVRAYTSEHDWTNVGANWQLQGPNDGRFWRVFNVDSWDPAHQNTWRPEHQAGRVFKDGEVLDSTESRYWPPRQKMEEARAATETDYVGDPSMGSALLKGGFKTLGQAKQAARVRRSQINLDKLPRKLRKRLLDPRRKDLLLDVHTDEGVIDWIRSKLMAVEQQRVELPKLLARVAKAKAVHVYARKWPQMQFMVFKGPRPDCRPFQLSYFEHGMDNPPTGHDCVASIAAGLTSAWKRYGPLNLVAMTEGYETPPWEKAGVDETIFWGNAGAGVLPVARSTGRILVGLRSASVNEPRTWGVFGGAIDPGEDPRAAARRELREELGYSGNITLLPAYLFAQGSFRYHNFIGVVDEEFTPRLNWETDRVEWMHMDDLLKLRPKHFGLKALIKSSMALILDATKREVGESLDEVKIPAFAGRLLHMSNGLRVGIDKTTGTLDLSGYINKSDFGGKGLGVVYITHPNDAPGLNKGGSVDIESAVTDPHTVETLKALIRVDSSIGKYLISKYTGYTGDVNSFVRKFDRKKFEPSTEALPPLYHGTSSKFAVAIKTHGLRPRGATGTAPTFGGYTEPSVSHRVYVGILKTAMEAARQAGNLHGGVPVVYRIVLPNSAALEPDEDSDEASWWRSLKKIGAVAYAGRVPAKYVKPYKAWPKSSKADPSGARWVSWNGQPFPREAWWQSRADRDASWKEQERQFAADREAARRAGQLVAVGAGESVDEDARAVVLGEALPPVARTSFDAAPYANMRLRDVARLLKGASQQADLNPHLIEKLVDRLIHALEFTIYSVQGRPEGRMIGDLIRGAFSNLSVRLSELGVRERARMTSTLATLGESLEDIEVGPARLAEAAS